MDGWVVLFCMGGWMGGCLGGWVDELMVGSIYIVSMFCLPIKKKVIENTSKIILF